MNAYDMEQIARQRTADVQAQTARNQPAARNRAAFAKDPYGRRFRDELGRLNARIAADSDEVWLCTAGIARRLR